MIRIFIGREVYRAPHGGGYALWLEKSVLGLLTRARGPRESYGDTILRLAAEEEAA